LRILALDIGERRIGVALSDPGSILASPLTTIESASDEAARGEIVRLAGEHEVGEIVVGIPVSMSGRWGPQAKRTAAFARELSKLTDIPVKRVDERLSSVQAERMMRESGASPSRDKGRIDALAAAIILQSYLDSKRAC
jgi:putative Holliday junction resolvase